jgi:hypothetical protein
MADSRSESEIGPGVIRAALKSLEGGSLVEQAMSMGAPTTAEIRRNVENMPRSDGDKFCNLL